MGSRVSCSSLRKASCFYCFLFSTDETGEPLIEPTSTHGQTIKIDPIDTFWIQCDECSKWFHGSCVGVEEYEDVLIDKFHCPQCAADKGPTKRRSYRVDTIDVYRQMTQSMSIGTFYEKMIAKQRPRLYNILSLEFSQNEKMKKLIAPPILVPELSFVHKLWPDRSDLVNWDPELNQVVEVLEEHRSNKPEVALFTLTGMAGSYTDFHIDFGGSSVWYHIYEGQKIFYIVEPTDKFLDLFEEYQRAENRTEKFFGDLVPPGALRRVVIEKGQTLMIPSGWIHAVYTPQDSLVFGGNFLHALNVPMQLKVYEMEQRLKKEVGTEDKFLFPHFELVNWYAARSLILESLREANDEGNRADQYIMDAAQALLPRLREWMRRDREEQGNMTPSSFNDVIMKLQREVNKQQRIRRSQSPACRSPKKTAKKRRSAEHELPKEAHASSVSNERPEPRPPSRNSPASSATPAPTHDTAPTHIGISITSTEAEVPSESMDDESPLDIRLKIVKKGNNYASSVVEKPDPMLEDVNMTQMFARRSSSGRQPRPSAWLAEAVGLEELERTAKKLEEQGEQLPEREVVTYDTEMELACEEEERNLMREERTKKKGKVAEIPYEQHQSNENQQQ
ncbi:PHD-finger [Oesophagostomum dentatum]|uniref:PHD-finger n=1 Tax=Oesophagostomum dentatum TaxID=61180 RepID=A0A0B1T0P9_OESDE|nr:PHD-finger [Oesophagostomum dentatum]